VLKDILRDFCLTLPSVPSCATVGQALRELAAADVLAAPAAGPHVYRCTMNKQSDDTGVEANVSSTGTLRANSQM